MNGMESIFQDPLFILIVLWSLPWKAVALWKAARNNEKWWYAAFLIINLAGLLEIIYIFYFDKKRGKTGKNK